MTLAMAVSPKPIVGAPSSIRIAVKGRRPSPLASIPEAESLAVASSLTPRFVQPGGTPAIRVSGSTVSTWRTAVAHRRGHPGAGDGRDVQVARALGRFGDRQLVAADPSVQRGFRRGAAIRSSRREPLGLASTVAA